MLERDAVHLFLQVVLHALVLLAAHPVYLVGLTLLIAHILADLLALHRFEFLAWRHVLAGLVLVLSWLCNALHDR